MVYEFSLLLNSYCITTKQNKTQKKFNAMIINFIHIKTNDKKVIKNYKNIKHIEKN